MAGSFGERGQQAERRLCHPARRPCPAIPPSDPRPATAGGRGRSVLVGLLCKESGDRRRTSCVDSTRTEPVSGIRVPRWLTGRIGPERCHTTTRPAAAGSCGPLGDSKRSETRKRAHTRPRHALPYGSSPPLQGSAPAGASPMRGARGVRDEPASAAPTAIPGARFRVRDAWAAEAGPALGSGVEASGGYDAHGA